MDTLATIFTDHTNVSQIITSEDDRSFVHLLVTYYQLPFYKIIWNQTFD
ncbi:hypothetical protein [Neobacillus sp. 19]